MHRQVRQTCNRKRRRKDILNQLYTSQNLIFINREREESLDSKTDTYPSENIRKQHSADQLSQHTNQELRKKNAKR